MHPIAQNASISGLKHRHLKIFARLQQGQIVLANRNHSVGVLHAPAQWDAGRTDPST